VRKDCLIDYGSRPVSAEGPSIPCLVPSWARGAIRRWLRGGQTAAPVFYRPCVAFVVQDRKRSFLGDRTFIYGPNCYLVLAAPLSFECETEASVDAPLLCLYVRLRRETIAELLASISPEPMPPRSYRGRSNRFRWMRSARTRCALEKVLLSLPYRPQVTEEPFRASIDSAEVGSERITVIASTTEPRARAESGAWSSSTT